MTTNTVRLHRVLRSPPDRLYRAFLDPAPSSAGCRPSASPARSTAWRLWSAAPGACPSPTSAPATAIRSAGNTWSWSRAERIAYDAAFDDPNLPGTMKTTVTLTRSPAAPMAVVQEGIPDVIPAEMCYLGWQESLIALAQLVEPDIPG